MAIEAISAELIMGLALMLCVLTGWLAWRGGMASGQNKVERVWQEKLQAQVVQVTEKEQQLLAANEQLEKAQAELDRHSAKMEKTLQAWQTLQQGRATLEERARQLPELKQKLTEKEQRVEELLQAQVELKEQLAQLSTAINKERESSADKIRTLEQAEKNLTTQFENLANRLFEEKKNQFVINNKQSLDSLLAPLQTQMGEFRKQISQSYLDEARERRTLKEEISSLKQLNQQMSEEALNLTRALKGDKKMQGNWGELVLDRVLQESGLRDGHEYHRQVSLKSDEGDRYQPDVIVHLPDDKDVVIDSKVSLVDWSRYHESSDEAEKEQALARHIQCLRAHIRQLSEKRYQDLQGLKTLDYVLLFIPVEPAFYAAIDRAPELFGEALERNIMIVSPTNLLVALRTIENIWRYEHQNRNAEEIAAKASTLYDKLRGFAEDMQRIGQQLATVSRSYDGAMRKFSEGKGNLVRQAQQFVELGVQVKKPIPKELQERAEQTAELSIEMPEIKENIL